MINEVLNVLEKMQECIHELRQDVERLDDNKGIQIGNSSFDYLDSTMAELKYWIKRSPK